jgi:phosphoadenosine phosphosulfate reductase
LIVSPYDAKPFPYNRDVVNTADLRLGRLHCTAEICPDSPMNMSRPTLISSLQNEMSTRSKDLSREQIASRLDAAFAGLDPQRRIGLLRETIDGRIVFTTSFGVEDQAITHLIANSNIEIDFVTLDTGRLFPETYDVWTATEERYGIRIRAFYPDNAAVESFIDLYGINGFYRSQDARNVCCQTRKVLPLGRALFGAAAWITGLRAEQSEHRQGFAFVTSDAQRYLIKANPLFDWSREDVVDYIAANEIPNSKLHVQGYLSIGCAPCTRALQPGEPERAGRWWWENEAGKECGLHLNADGRLVPAKRLDGQKP